MTTPAEILKIPAEIIAKAVQIEIQIQKFEEHRRVNGKADETIERDVRALKQVARYCDIENPEEVKKWLAGLIEPKCTWNNKTKTRFCSTYSAYLIFREIKWIVPTYLVVNKLPFIPTEQEIDLLISAMGKTTSTVLQMLKETGMRIGELVHLKWINLDGERKTISITPEKGSNPRILPVSDKLLGMINRLPRNHGENIFQPKKRMLREYFCTQRKAIAEKMNNPRLLKISFHTLRHWKGTMEYHKTKDIMHVKYVLGHKSINCTLIYINLESALFLSNTDEWISKVSHNLDEETQLIEAGFQLVRSINETTAIYKKRK
jgi:integrase